MMMVGQRWNIYSSIVTHILVKKHKTPKTIYDLKFIPGKELTFFINIGDLIHKNIFISKQEVSPNLFFEQVLTQLMDWKGFPPFLGKKYSALILFQITHGHSYPYTDETLFSVYNHLKPPRLHSPYPWIPHPLSPTHNNWIHTFPWLTSRI